MTTLNSGKKQIKKTPLHKYLGLTKAEYKYWKAEAPRISDRDALLEIYTIRERGLNIKDMQLPKGTKVRWTIYRGLPNEGGIGEDVETIWDENPVTVNGQIVWFDDEKEAKKLARKLTKKSAKNLKNTEYIDYVLPIEYGARKTPWAETEAWNGEEALKQITQEEKHTWGNGTNYL